MKIFKNFITILFIMFLGIYLGTYLYKSYLYKNNNDKLNLYKIYLLEYGVYNSYENMDENGKNIENYFYYSNNDEYHILLGITENKNIINKIGESYENIANINIREDYIDNMEFIESLKQYDNLIINSNKTEILQIERQVLGKYEDLILNNESNIN